MPASVPSHHEDDALLRRTRRLLAEVTQFVGEPSGTKTGRPKRLDGATRRRVLMLIADLDEQLKSMQACRAQTEQEIVAVGRQLNAAAAYSRSAAMTRRGARGEPGEAS